MTRPKTMPLKSLRRLRRPLEFLREMQAHGDVVRVGSAYFVNQPDALREMLVANPGGFDKGVHFEKAKVVIGNSLPVSDGPFHRQQRKLVHPAFKQARLREYFDIMRECTLNRVHSWTPDTDVHAEMRSLVGLITCRTLFSATADESISAELVGMIDTLDKGVMRRVVDPTGLWAKLPLPSNRRFRAYCTRTRELVDGFVDAYHREPPDRSDLLSTLLSAHEDGAGMSDEQLRDEAVAMMQAGIETTAQVLRWACAMLCAHPEAHDRVQAEVDEVVGDRPVEFDDLERLEYLGRVIRETLRLYPPLFLITRRALSDVVVGGHRIPAGSTILFSSYALHHDEQIYPDPERFDPDRWLGAEHPPVSYMPFGAGIRSCLGERFAQMEMLIVVSTVVQNWTMRRAPGVDVRPKLSFVLSPNANGTRLTARSRSQAPAHQDPLH